MTLLPMMSGLHSPGLNRWIIRLGDSAELLSQAATKATNSSRV